MALTAIVITFGVSALLLSLVYRVYTAHEAADGEERGGEWGDGRPPDEEG